MSIVERCALEVGNLVGRARSIALVGNDDLRTLRKLGAILLELAVDDAIVLNRIAILKPPVMSTTCMIRAVRSMWRKNW